MANYEGTGRTNYVRIKDINALRADIEKWNIGVEVVEKDGLYAVLGDTGDDLSLPSWAEDDDGNELNDPIELIASHMEDGEIMVFMQSGHEKQRYVDGWASAMDNQGAAVALSLDDIYAKAAEHFGVHVNTITQATH